jgi:hypothetical protein
MSAMIGVPSNLVMDRAAVTHRPFQSYQR